MKMKLYTGAMLLFVLLTACGGEATFEEKSIDGIFTIELPTYMDELDLGIPEASVAYGNEMKEHYITVIRESPSGLAAYGITNVQDYAEMYISGVEMSIDAAKVNQIGDGVETQNGMEVLTYEVDGVMPNEQLGIYYYIKFYQSATAYYYVLDWTLSDFKDDHLSDMQRITNSLKEL